MCGIVGYIGDQEASTVLIEALKKLEYRGYDSSGLAMVGGSDLHVKRSLGYITNLQEKVGPSSETAGISHTRWATHGVPSEENAHPHIDGSSKIAVVHNGIVDNHLSLKKDLTDRGHIFYSQTDSEVIPHVIQEEYEGNGGDLLEAVRTGVGKLEGSYAIVVVHKDHPDLIISARMKSPMVLGRGVNEGFVASDVTALLKYTNQFLYMEDGEIARITRDEIHLETLAGEEVKRDWTSVDWGEDDAEKGGFAHFMIKEIFEQPHSLHQTLTGWRSEEESLSRQIIEARMLRTVACGTSYHAGLVGRYLFEKYTSLPTQVDMASEYRYANATLDDSLVILMTQSGETADTIAAAREAKRRGMRTIAMTNVVGSTITRESDMSLYLRSGPEIGVAASKTFTSQVMMMYLLSSHMGHLMGRISRDEHDDVLVNLRRVIRAVERILNDVNPIKEQAKWLSKATDAFYIGRHINFPTALEGALKMKEISYIHCEGYPAGELKHGPLALLTKETPIIALISDDHTYDKMLGNVGECSARSSPVLAIAPESDPEVARYTDRILYYPDVDPLFSPIPISVILQLLAYYTAQELGREIDKPRNLAKSVTVE